MLNRGRGQQRGFTLLELMFVVAIIGILAAMAIPQYQTYMIRAKLAEGFAQASLPVKAVADYYSFHGRFPMDNAAAALPAPERFGGEYLQRLEVANGAIHLHYHAEVMGPEWPGGEAILSLRPQQVRAYPPGNTLVWLCGAQAPIEGMSVQGEDRTTIPALYLPPSCVE